MKRSECLDVHHVRRTAVISLKTFEPTEDRGKRDVHLAHRKILAETAAGAAGKRYQAALLLSKLL